MSRAPLDNLCFIAAHKAASRHHASWKSAEDYTDDKFFRHLIRHFQNVRHEEDKPPFEPVRGGMFWSRASTVAAIRQAALTKEYQPLSESQTETLKHLFLACDEGSLESVKAENEVLQKLGVPESLFVQPLAVLAIEATNAECLNFCRDRGALYDENMMLALDWCLDHSNRAVTSGILDWAYENDWRNIKNDQVSSPPICPQLFLFIC